MLSAPLLWESVAERRAGSLFRSGRTVREAASEALGGAVTLLWCDGLSCTQAASEQATAWGAGPPLQHVQFMARC